MNKTNNNSPIRCFISAPLECGYLPEHESKNLIIDPSLTLSDSLFGDLLNTGFRRSGSQVYRPQCDHCQACISIRIPARKFNLNRSQRRNWDKNQDLQQITTPAEFKQEHFDLYQRYIDYKHPNSSMNSLDRDDYSRFLIAPGITTHFHEFRLNNELLAVAVTDHVPLGLSAVYTFYNPDHIGRGLGNFAILWQIQHAQQQGLAWLYLGYWVKECDKMRYKSGFRPHDGYINGRWQPIA